MIAGQDGVTELQAATGTSDVEVVASTEGFDAIEAEWNALLEESETRIFQTFEWQRTWWKHYGEGLPSMQLHLLLVREAGELIGIAPLVIETVTALWPVSYRILYFNGRGPSDYLDVIARRGKERQVAESVAGHIASVRESFEVLLLEDITELSQSGPVLFEALTARGLTGERFLGEYCPRLALDTTFEATSKSFSRSKRTRMLRNAQSVFSEFGATYERVSDPAGINEAMDEFIQIHQARWNNVGHQGVFADPRADRFHRDVVHSLHRRGWLMLTFLRVNGTRMAGDYGLRFRESFMTYLGGVRGGEEFLRFSPGRALLMEVMKNCIQQGATVFDYMRGTERYKYDLGGVDVPNWTIMMFSRPGKWPRVIHRAAILRESLQRRATHEWVHLVYHQRKHGLISAAFVRYLAGRVATVVSDGMQKFRSPEKTIIIGKIEQ